MKKQPSIMSFFSLLGLVLLTMAVIVIGTMVYGLTMQSRLQVQFMNRTAACDAILVDLNQMQQEFADFSKNWSLEEYNAYQKTCDRLAENLGIYRFYCQDVPVTLNYIRRIENFNIYQKQQIEKALERKDIRYDASVYITNGLALHQQQGLQMAQNDMREAKNTYDATSQKMFRRLLAVAAIFSGAAIIMGGILAHFSIVTKRGLYDMTEHLNGLAKRDWNTPDLAVSRYREFTLISQTVNRMKQEIKDSIKEIENRARLEKQLDEERLINEKQHAMIIAAQMSALRAQVNPHFLFNSLNMIGVTALVGDSKIVMQMVEATGMILRYSLYHEGTMTSLDEELEIVCQYLFLQKCRFGDAVRVEIHNELEGEDILIPVMSIQPIVENSFKHGFGSKKSLYIHIAVTREEQAVSICVTDDGIGFDTERIFHGDGSGIGLNNIKKRLELMYGEFANMEMKSRPNEYTSVTLLIPQKEGIIESSGC